MEDELPLSLADRFPDGISIKSKIKFDNSNEN